MSAELVANIMQNVPNDLWMAFGGSVGFYFALENAFSVVLKFGKVPKRQDWLRRATENVHALHAIIHGCIVAYRGRHFDRLGAIELGFYAYECLKSNLSVSDVLHHFLSALSYFTISRQCLRNKLDPGYARGPGWPSERIHAALAVVSHCSEPFKDLSTLLTPYYPRLGRFILFVHYVLYSSRIFIWPLLVALYWKQQIAQAKAAQSPPAKEHATLTAPEDDGPRNGNGNGNGYSAQNGTEEEPLQQQQNGTNTDSVQNGVIKQNGFHHHTNGLADKNGAETGAARLPPVPKFCYASSALYILLNCYWYRLKLRKLSRQ